jgi:predicted TIM-barrel fold metal-dependent hydrolase
MDYEVISADCHIDLIWLPEDLFTAEASRKLAGRMPYVEESEKGPLWVSKKGAVFGLQNGMGSAGREYIPGQIHRSDAMAATGLYEDGKKGIRRLTVPELRIQDQDRDGVQAEVLYGILGAAQRLKDDQAATEVMRIYNEWLGDFCASYPERFAGLACIPNHDIDAAVEEIHRVAKRGQVRGVEISNTLDMKPVFDPSWTTLWQALDEVNLPVHFHTIGGRPPNFEAMLPLQRRQSFAVFITGFQLQMSRIVMELIYGGVLEAYSNINVVIGESGIGWIPYILEHMDLEWEDQFKDLTLTMKPSEYWQRQCKATYQSDKVGIKLLAELGEDNIMWGSDFPHPDGIWPDSQEFIARELGHLPAIQKKKIICDNAARLYGFV